MIEHREGPETCNTYNMLRLTEQLFASRPEAGYADYYERALYNHILSSIDPAHPGYVYFTPLRPQHYRVYSQPEQGFWCCVGTGMENPGQVRRVHLRPSQRRDLRQSLHRLRAARTQRLGLTLRQDTTFPDQQGTRLTLTLDQPTAFTLHVRQPGMGRSRRLSP